MTTTPTIPEVGQVWIHRTSNPAHQHYGRQVSIEYVGRDLVRIKGQHRSHWEVHEFTRTYEYAFTPTPEPMPDADPVFEQLTLDLGELVEPAYDDTMTIQQRFEAFHAANPWVLRAYEKLAADWVARGGTRVGVKMLTEIIRWQYGRQTTGKQFRINNSFTSRYARLMLERNPGWSGLFETRGLRA